MRWGWSAVAMVMLAAAALAVDEPQNLTLLSCAQVARDPACNPSKADLKKSKAAFSKALKLQKDKQFDEAYEEFDTAARLAPRNVEYVTALAMVRQQLVYDHLQQGNEDLTKGKVVEAQAEFRSAANLDPQNEFAKQRLRDSLAEWSPTVTGAPRVVADSTEVRVVSNTGPHDFHFRGDSHALLTQVAGAYGVSAEFDESVVSRRVHFDIEGVDFYAAMRLACDVTGAFWVPLSEKQIYLARDNVENHRQFDHMGLRTFYLPGATTPQEMNEMTTLLRTIFDIRFVSQQPQAGMLAVRAPSLVLDAVTELFRSFAVSRPQVLLDIQVFEVDHQLTRDMGIHIPNNFTLINIPAGAVAALTGLLGGLGGQNIQSLINQLISSGGINQANSQGIAGLIAQLTGQQGGTGPASIFSQPYATFGGGLTLMGLSLDTLSAELSLNESWVKTLEHSTLRAAEGNEATFRMGSRYPII
ncbi:MAG: hypothetical protein WB711_05190, partial [Terriglobales bacterium]